MDVEKFENITVKELVKKILHHQHLFIVDARDTDAFDDWKVEGKNVEIINVPYSEVKKKGTDAYLEKLPKNDDIYVICAKGGSSQKVAQHIVDAGYSKVFSVEGGMNAWSEHLEPIKIGDLESGGSIFQFVRIGKGCLSYIVESNGEAAIIDANRMLAPYEAFVSDHKVSVTRVLDTHLHADHISGGRKFAQKYGAKYYLPPKDAEEVTFEYKEIMNGDEYIVGEAKIQALYSPGHTIGSTSFIVDDKYLLTGDILFIDSIGRPDLAGKAEDWVGDLRDTLYKRYKELTDELLVLPAHYMSIKEMNEDGSISEKLGVLYEKNQGLNIKDEGDFRKKVTENLPPQPNSYEQIRETNMGKLSPEEEKQREMETGPNRCAVS